MNRRDLKNLIAEGESGSVEFKQRFSTHTKIAKEIIAFANTKGGYLIFGVDDDKSIYGVESEKHETELILEAANKYCEPPIKVNIKYFEIDHKEILVCRIDESNIKPHRIQDYQEKLNLSEAQVYVRVKDKSLLASKEMIKLLQNSIPNLKKYSIGKNEKIVFEYLDKYESITVKDLSKIANISSRRASRTLINLVRVNLLFIHKKDNGEEFFTQVS